MKKNTKLLLLALSIFLLLIGCNNGDNPSTTSAAEESISEETTTEETTTEETEARLEDDFYEAVNAQWLAETELPATDIMVGAFTQISDTIEEQLMSDFESMKKGDTEVNNAQLDEFLKYYAMTEDYETRNAQGNERLVPYLEQIDNLSSMEDLDTVLGDWMTQGMASPFSMSVMADMGNASVNALYASAPTLYLPDVSYYESATGTQLLEYFSQSVQECLVLSGYTKEEASSITAQAIEFDALLVPYIKSAEEASEYTLMYNPITMSEFAAYCSSLDLNNLVSKLVGTLPEQIIVTDPAFFEVMDELVNEENFEIMKSWLTVNTVYSLSSYLSEDYRNAMSSYSMILTGQMEMEEPQVVAYYLASTFYSEVVGNYYGETYFGQEAKEDVTNMVNNMIDVYIDRLNNNDWLGSETINAAITKLENISIQIGYPEELNPVYSQLIVKGKDDGGTVLSNAMAFSKILLADNFAKYGTEVDRSAWSLSADTVNAMYSPLTNAIMFPAAILQEPFYSLEQTPSENYGGIGAVIAHEITHAFDNNGAQFDECGNLKNWWTKEDYAAFEERTTAMVELFDGLEHAGGSVNGQLTVSENIADAGGISCALEITKSLPDANLEEFFTNWATIWRMKATSQIEQLLLTLDVHAPNKLRANVQLQNLEEFYSTFDIKEEDGMYLPEDKRVNIW